MCSSAPSGACFHACLSSPHYPHFCRFCVFLSSYAGQSVSGCLPCLFFFFFCFIPSFPGSHSPRSCLLCLLLTPILSSFSSHLLQVVFVDSLFHRCCFVAGVCPVSHALMSHLYRFYLGVHATKFSSNETSCTSSCTCMHSALQGSAVASKSGGMLMGLRDPCLHLKALKHARILLVWKVRGIKGVRAGKEGWG